MCPFAFLRRCCQGLLRLEQDAVLCANKKVASAMSTCVGGSAERGPSYAMWADVLGSFRGEKLTYDGNAARCSDWGRQVGDPQRIGPFQGHTGHCLLH